MQKKDARTWIKSMKLDGKGTNVLTARLLSMKSKWAQRYCNLLLEEFVNEGFLQNKVAYVIDDFGSSRPTKIYWKR